MCEEKCIISIEKCFILIALIVGGILLFLTPPMAVPDENDHLFNAYALSEANIFSATQGDETGRLLPNCLIDFVNVYNTRFSSKLDEKYDFAEAYVSWALPSDFTERSFKPYWNSRLNLIGYLPSGIGIAVYRILSKFIPFVVFSAYNVMMVGRICNLIFYVIIIYYAIKWTPILKYTIFLISLLPMSIFLAASLSYDTMTIGFCTLLFSRVMNILHSDRKATKKDLVVISICALILINVKSAYAPLLLILFSLTVTRFDNLKKYISYALCVLGGGWIPFLIYQIGQKISLKNFTYVYSEAMNAQAKVILSAPFWFIGVIGNSLRQFGKFYYLGCLGSLGQQDTNLPEVFLYLLTIIIVFVALVEISSQNVITNRIRLFSVIGIFLAIYAMFAGTYIIWTGTMYGIGLDHVQGCQGRYFIPLLVWSISLFGNSKLKNCKRVREVIPMLAVGSSVFISMITILCVFLRFWV